MKANDKFAMLTALHPCDRPDGIGGIHWTFRCDCGAVRNYRVSKVVSGTKKSCGCLIKIRSRERAIERNTIHGQTRSKAFRTWSSMKDRCMNKRSKYQQNYGGRGILVCSRWMDFSNFLADMGHPPTDDHSIDRIDNDGNYEPGNCRWATIEEQNRNKRSNIRISLFEETKTLAEWCRFFRINYNTARNRFHRGLPAHAIFGCP